MKKVLAVMLVMMLVAFTFGCKKSEPPKSADAPKSVESSAPVAGGRLLVLR